MSYKTVKGTYDILPEKYTSYEYLEEAFKALLERYGYDLIRTPVIEYAGVFRKENDTSDMVTKEMFSFSLNEKDTLTLRPEGTAGVVRAVIEHKLYGSYELPLKLAYIGEMFRHENPQKGRQRQFTQFGIENIGAKNPLIDAEVIALGVNFVQELGIRNTKVLINTLGDSASRLAYQEALKKHFAPYYEELCADCKKRYEKNALRILDCKIDHEQEFVKNAPLLKDYLSEEAKVYFEKVLAYLDALNIEYEIDQRLVRGLDYYTDTVFEVVSTNPESGSQATIFAGGRYDNLVKEMGGPELSGIGFALGEERLMIALEAENAMPSIEKVCDVYVIDLTGGDPYALQTAEALRKAGYVTELNLIPRSLKSQFKSVDRKNAAVTVIVGEDEIANKVVQVKNNQTKEQKSMTIEELIENLDRKEEDYA
ncbi:MAG: histidine--tRNA ligase [Erysipelotrichaceae bacterium]|nr:histidine--tRNA ligase [Erysipelotrichaceae bacterium]